MKDLKKMLIRELESCIKTLEAYINDEEVIIISPSIIVDDGSDQNITETKRKVGYSDIQTTDETFKNYCSGLMGLYSNPIFYVKKYIDLRNKCDEIFETRKK